MGLFIEIKNVSGQALSVLNDDGDRVTIHPDETLTVSRDVAGQAPHWRRVEVDENGAPTEHVTAAHLRDRAGHYEIYDLGRGLLAQPSNWSDGTDVPEPDDDGGGKLIETLDPNIPAEPVTTERDEENE